VHLLQVIRQGQHVLDEKLNVMSEAGEPLLHFWMVANLWYGGGTGLSLEAGDWRISTPVLSSPATS
jgi:hypothetical protein